MSIVPGTKPGLGTDEKRSEMDPGVVQPGSKADPSTAPEWKDHVKDYFNADATPGEALPGASHEAKDPAGSDQA